MQEGYAGVWNRQIIQKCKDADDMQPPAASFDHLQGIIAQHRYNNGCSHCEKIKLPVGCSRIMFDTSCLQ